MSIILFSIALAAAANPDQSYTKSTSVGKFYNNNQATPYTETTLLCKSGSSTYNKLVYSAKSGFSVWSYYANELPYYADKSGKVVQKTTGAYSSFDDAAKKACFG